MVPVPADVLRELTWQLLHHAGMNRPDAEQAADVLVSADLRGVETHGVSHMLRVYLDWLTSGRVNPSPSVQTVRERPGTATLDADRGIGVVVAPQAMRLAIEKASAVGIGMVSIRNSRHLGMAAYHAMMALPHGMIGVCTSAVGPLVVPTFGAEPRLGTNPIAVAAPTGSQPAFVFDAAMSAIPGNRIPLAHRLGQQLPAGTIADEHGTPIMTPQTPAANYADARLLPLGSTRATGSHKGYGLAMIAEILSSVLSGWRFIYELGTGNAAHAVLAIDVAAFVDPDVFTRTMDDYLQMLRATPPAPDQDRVLYAGLLEAETEQRRRAEGVPLHPDVVAWLDSAASAAGLSTLSQRL